MVPCTISLFKDITAKPSTSTGENRAATTPGTPSPTLFKQYVFSLTSHRELMNVELEKGKEFYLRVYSFLRWSTNWGHCKLKSTINANQVKCWFLRRGQNRSTRRKNLWVQSREPTNSTHKGRQVWESNRTWATLVGGKCSHPCTILASFICEDLKV